jgi:ComF family protein
VGWQLCAVNDRGSWEMGSRLIGNTKVHAKVRRLWLHALPRAGKSLVDLVYPPRCVWCHGEAALPDGDDIALCLDCRSELAPPVLAWCGKCGAPLSGAIAKGLETPPADCFHCQSEKYPWQQVVALGAYAGELAQAVVRTKSPHADSLSLALGKLLFVRREAELANLKCDAIIPMPLHWARRFVRGTNGPDLIAEPLAKGLRLPLRRRWLRRRKLTSMQGLSTATERRQLQRGSFRAAKQVAGKRVLLVDDVLTTGSTAGEATKVLLAAGATSVSIAVLARGIGESSA